MAQYNIASGALQPDPTGALPLLEVFSPLVPLVFRYTPLTLHSR